MSRIKSWYLICLILALISNSILLVISPSITSWIVSALVIFQMVLLLKSTRGRQFLTPEENLRRLGLYPPVGQGSDVDVERLVAGGHKIPAIKLYRELHQAGLKEALEAVNALENRHLATLQTPAQDDWADDYPRKVL